MDHYYPMIKTKKFIIYLNKKKNQVNSLILLFIVTTKAIAVSTYLISQSVEQQKLFSSCSRVLSDEWSDRYYSDYSDLGNVNYGYISSETFSASVNDAYVLFGIKNSSLIEITLNKSGSTSVRYTNDVVETGTELIGNWILAVINSYKN